MRIQLVRKKERRKKNLHSSSKVILTSISLSDITVRMESGINDVTVIDNGTGIDSEGRKSIGLRV